MKRCPRCQETIASYALVCSACGNHFETAPSRVSVGYRDCPRCQHEAPGDAQHCPACGTALAVRGEHDQTPTSREAASHKGVPVRPAPVERIAPSFLIVGAIVVLVLVPLMALMMHRLVD